MNTSTAAYLTEICKNYDASTYEHCKRHPTLVPLILEYIQNTMNAGDIKYAAKLTVISRIYSPEQEIMNDTPKKEHPAELYIQLTMNNSATLPSMTTESVDRLIYLLTEKDGIHIHQRLANLETSVASRFPVFLNILVCGDIEKFLAGDSYTIVRGLNTVLNIHRDGDLSVHNTQAIARIAFELFLGLMRTIKPIRDTVRYMNLDTEFSGLSTWCVWSHPYHPLKEIKRVLTEFSDEGSDAFDYVEVIDA